MIFDKRQNRRIANMAQLGVSEKDMRISRERDAKAKDKRERRRLRNISNEAAQGRYPEQAECGCGKWGEVNYDGNAYYCGGSERCIP